MKIINKIIIGTAFYINNYSINKKNKIINKNSLLKYCIQKKIFHFDTAPTYGSAEKNLGKINNKNIIVDTKLSKIKSGLSEKKKRAIFKKIIF